MPTRRKIAHAQAFTRVHSLAVSWFDFRFSGF